MAPPTKERVPRVQKFHEIGQVGRMTGVQPPKNVSRDSTGFERPEAFFDSPNNSRTSPNKQPKRQSRPSEGTQRGRERPDLHAEIGQVGRKTGVTRAPLARDEAGFENADDFFASSPQSLPSANKSKASSQRQSNGSKQSSSYRQSTSTNRTVQAEDNEEQEYDQDDDESIGAESSPRALKANAPNSSVSRPRNFLNRAVPHSSGLKSRASGSNGKSKSQSRFGNGSTDWDQIPGSDRQAPIHDQSSSSDHEVSRPRNARLDKLSMSTNGRGNGSPNSSRSLSGPSPSSARSSKSKRESLESPSQGKGKGKARSMPSSEQEENPDLDFVHDDFGGGGEDEEMQYIIQPGADGSGDDQEEDEEQEEQEQEQEGTEEPEQYQEDQQPENSDSSDSEPVVVVPKKVKAVKAKKAASKRASPDQDEDGVRRSVRQKIEPVEYWRNERVIYERRQSGMGIRDVVRIAKAPLPKSKPYTKSASRGRSERPKSEPFEEENGVDEFTIPEGHVWNWEGDCEIERRIAFTAKMVAPQPAYNSTFMFQKIFTELDYFAAGILQIPAGQEKPMKPAKDNSYTFYCIQGAVSVLIHRTRFAIGPGGAFFVPRGNSYSITTTSNRDVKLFFTQGRRVVEFADGTSRPDLPPNRIDEEDEGEEEEEEEGDGEEEEGDDQEEEEDNQL